MICSNEISNTEYNAYYQPYIKSLKETELFTTFDKSLEDTLNLIENLNETELLFRYAEGKWTIKEIVQHLLDAERIFAYRALRFSRNDSTNLPGYDEDSFVFNSDANKRSKADLLLEIKSVRNATVTLFNSFNQEMFLKSGIANQSTMSVRAAGFIICGHQWHHLKIIQERYLSHY